MSCFDAIQPPHRHPERRPPRQTIRAGDQVTPWWRSANRTDEMFSDPFGFCVRRYRNPHLAGGHGAHFCLGTALARIESRLLFDALLDRFRDLVRVGAVQWTRGTTHTGVRHMSVTFRRRQ